MQEESSQESREIPHQGQDGEKGQEDAVEMRAQQAAAGRQLVGGRLAEGGVEAGGKVVGAAQLVVVCPHLAQFAQLAKQCFGKVGHWAPSQVYRAKFGREILTIRRYQLTNLTFVEAKAR